MNANGDSTPIANSDESAIETGLKRLKGKDRIGRAGEVAGVAGGVAAGATAAGTIAGAVGATTLLGSPGLATLLGGVFVTSTPVGWVVGCALVGGAAAYGVVKLARSGGHQDALRDRLSKSLTSKLRRVREQKSVPDGNEFAAALAIAIDTGAMAPADAERMRALVAQGKLVPDLAARRLQLLLQAHSTTSNPSSGN